MYVNAPRYLLRKHCALKLIRDLKPSKALEIGCGAGDFCETVYKMGFDIQGVDFSKEAVDLCQERLKNVGGDKKIRFGFIDFWQIVETFDVIFFFEVLEHIGDDRAAIAKIYRLLNPGGHLILSVPAHRQWFGPSDRAVGHFRRYDKKDILTLLSGNHFKIQTIWSYGFPLANLTEMVRNLVAAGKITVDKEEGTRQSGIDRRIESHFRFFLNDVFFYPLCILQMPFLKTDWGTGYIIRAVRE